MNSCVYVEFVDVSFSFSFSVFGCVCVCVQKEQLWSGCADAGELCVWYCKDLTKPFHRIQLQDCAGVLCMIKVKNQVSHVFCLARLKRS